MDKPAQAEFTIHKLIEKRWSPRVFSSSPVDRATLEKLFEAARWAPSSFNEQPWRFILASKESPEEFEKALSCLVPANQEWVRNAPILILTVISKAFALNGKPNRTAQHDLGLAVAQLTFQATAENLFVHQMGGVDLEKVRKTYNIPDDYEPVTAIAIGYGVDEDQITDPKIRESELAPRTRKKQGELVFGTKWGEAARALKR